MTQPQTAIDYAQRVAKHQAGMMEKRKTKYPPTIEQDDPDIGFCQISQDDKYQENFRKWAEQNMPKRCNL